jgi:two-component system cell cycle response regulator
MATILVVEDDATTREAMAALLRDDGHVVVTASDGVAALAAVEQSPPDLVISDVRMPRGDGFHLVRRLRALPRSVNIPILLVSALGDPARKAAGLDLGADDFIAKPVDTTELLARVRAHLRQVRRREELERRAIIDPLTGVVNRRGIYGVLQKEEQRARRGGTPLSVLMIDIDRFKALNDRYGHQAGDTALRYVAAALADAVRIADHVGRCGGDEFLVVLAGTDAPDASALAQRLRNLRLPALALGEEEVPITISIGAATLRPDDTIDAMVERADREMYRVKRTGEMPAVTPADPPSERPSRRRPATPRQ